MAELLEAIMLICFGLSWPLNAYKNYRAGTAVGTSWQFIALITAGYFAGIAAKFVSGNLNWVLIVYFINVVCIAANWLVYFRNRRLDAPASAGWSWRKSLSSWWPRLSLVLSSSKGISCILEAP
ncbi:MAG: hypothetical protein ACLTDR_15220 [Adlercreutzia equolifaciens]